MKNRARVIVSIYVLAFAAATAIHASDIVRWGWLPYRFAPLSLNVFWSMLVVLDPVVVSLLLFRRLRSALVLAVSIMVADVAANSYAFFALGYSEFAASLQLQAGFLGFVIGSAPFLWGTNEERVSN